MMAVGPYLNFNGQCEDAFKFYEKLMGARIETMIPYEGTPMETMVALEWRKKIMHAGIIIGDRVVSGADALPGHYEAPKGLSVMLQLSSDLEAERIFAGLAEGGRVQMALQPTFWATRFGMTIDRFGIPWMINCSQPV